MVNNLKKKKCMKKEISKDCCSECHAAADISTSAAALDRFAEDKEWTIRRAVACNPRTPIAVLAKLTEDEDCAVRIPATNKIAGRFVDVMKKEAFIQIMALLKEQNEFDERVGQLIGEAFIGTCAPVYDNDKLWKAVELVLEFVFSDSTETINWWMYEKKFGKREDLQMSVDDNEVDTSDAGKLYDLLMILKERE